MDLLIYIIIKIILFFVLLFCIFITGSIIIVIIFIVFLITFIDSLSFALSLLTFSFAMLLQRLTYSEGSRKLYDKYFDVKIEGALKDEPCIYVSNYPNTQVGYLMIPYLGEFTLLGRAFRDVGFQSKLSSIVYNKNNYIQVRGDGKNYDYVKSQINKNIRVRNRSIFGYVENLRYRMSPYKLTKLRTGLFKIAKELNIKIVPIVIDHIKYDNFGNINNNKIHVFIGDPYDASKYSNTDNLINDISTWMQQKLDVCYHHSKIC